jgi:Holliday junction resolvase RusA-like endonuclease
VIQFTIPGIPVPKGRPRARIIKGGPGKPDFVSLYTPSETVAYEGKVSQLAKVAMGSRAASIAPIEVLMELRMPIPVSWSKKKQIAAAAGQVRATKKPDGDNVLKAITDACNGIVWADDSQLVVITVRKKYAADPCVILAVREVEGESA